METKFQTSFIPKKPITPIGGAGSSMGISTPKRKHTSYFMAFAMIVFILSLSGVGLAYGWKVILAKQQEGYKQELKEREKLFNIDLIEQLKQVNVQIDTAKNLLRNHLAVSQIFDIISRMTAENIRFLNLDLTVPNPNIGDSGSGLTVTMSGYGNSFSAVAFQSRVLSQLERYNLRKIIKNPIISEPALDSEGTVSFGFSATIDPTTFTYDNFVNPLPVEAETEQTGDEPQQ